MKRSRPLLFGAVLLILVTSAQAWAEEGIISVGLRSWFSIWDTGEIINSSGRLSKSDTTLSWGPTITYRKGKLLLGVSFVKGEYDIKDTSADNEFSLSVERSETDLIAGLQITPNVALFAGLKHELADLEKITVISLDEDVDKWLTVFAVNAHHVFDIKVIPVTIFGTLALVNGALSGEIGGAVPIAKSPFSIYGGYKRQELGDDANVAGAFFGINYSLS